MMSLPKVSRPALVSFVTFSVVALLVLADVTARADVAAVQAIASWRTPMITTFMLAVSAIGEWYVEIPLVLVVLARMYRMQRSAIGWRFLALALGTEATYALAKLIGRRPRPELVERLSHAGWYSFPSGHAMLAPVIWGFGLVLVATTVQSGTARRALWTLSWFLPVMIAISRVYLGVHYPTDVIAGLALGLGMVFWWQGRVRGMLDR